MDKVHDTAPAARADSKAIHVCFGHVPYAPSLPSVMPLPQFSIDWWFYGGWASDKANSKQLRLCCGHRECS